MDAKRKWLREVAAKSHALGPTPVAMRLQAPTAIARALKPVAEKRRRLAASPFRSALSMLTFYVNRAAPGVRTRASMRRSIAARAPSDSRVGDPRPSAPSLRT